LKHSRPAALVLAFALGSSACERAAKAPAPASVAYDFARLALAADHEGPWPWALLGTPAAVPWQHEGFVPTAQAWQDEPYVWLRRSAELRLPAPPGDPQRVVLDLAPHPEVEDQSVELFRGDRSLGRLRLENRRKRYLVSLPGNARESEPRLRLSFAKGTAKLPAYRRSLAAALWGVAVGAPDDPALEALARDGSPPLLAVVRDQGVPSIVQAAPGALSFVLRVPKGAEMRFTPQQHPASAGRSATLRVSVEQSPGPARTLWEGPAGAGDAAEIAVPLALAPGTLVRLSLGVLGEKGGGPLWAVWKAPRLLGAGEATAATAAATRPREDARVGGLRRALAAANVLLVILDATAAKHVGAYGYGRATTPELDRIAAEGVVFERAFTPAVYTLAAMSSLWTSRYPDEHGNVDPRTASLGRARLTLVDLLAAQGIATVGVVANGMAGPGFGFDRGFEEFREIYREFGQRADADSFREVLPAWFAAHRDRRFFAYLHYREPHWPYDPKPPFDTAFGPDGPIPKNLRDEVAFMVELNHHRRPTTPDEIDHLIRLYDGNLAFVDRELGFLRKTLEGQGLWDRTVVIVSSDHGEEMWEHGLIGHESQLFDPALQVPLILRFPRGAGPAGVRVQGLADLLDLAPTIADVFGVLDKGGARDAFGGRTLLPMLYGAPGKNAIVSRTRGEQPRWSLRDARYKLIYDGKLGTSQLFDLASDPGETRDLAPGEPLLAAFLRQGLALRLLEMKPDTGRTGADTELNTQQLENLRALGYVH
jgi:arylsulfatase A-like enzyme